MPRNMTSAPLKRLYDRLLKRFTLLKEQPSQVSVTHELVEKRFLLAL